MVMSRAPEIDVGKMAIRFSWVRLPGQERSDRRREMMRSSYVGVAA